MVSSRVNSNDGYLVFAPNGHSVSIPKEDHYFEMSDWPRYLEIYQRGNDVYKLKGIVSISSPIIQKTSAVTAVYSIDFGTSSTNVGVRVVDPVINSFADQTMMITETERFASVKSINEVFYGNFPVSAPFPTLYYERYIGSCNFSDGHTYFVETNKTINIKDNNIKSNIKFGANNENKIRYVNSLLNYIMVDAKKAGYSKISFIFSYSFSMPNSNIFKRGIEEVIERLKKENRYGVIIQGEPKFISESVAALKYARKTEETNEIVVIDIGGGSVDICVHSPALDKNDVSLRIASFEHGSRHFFINNFKLNYKLLPGLLAKNPEIKTGKHVESFYINPEEFREKVIHNSFRRDAERNTETDKILPDTDSFIENLFSLNIENNGVRKNLGTELKNAFLQDNHISKKYYQTLWMFQLSAIMFYCAMMAAEMQKKRANDFFNTITILLAGKGSKIIGWLPQKSLERLKSVFESTFNAYKFARKVVCKIKFDEQSAKNEGVLGMLNDNLHLADRNDLGEKDIMEGYLRGEQNADKKEFSEIDLIDGDKFDFSKELPVYNRFISAFNSMAGTDFCKIKIMENTETDLVQSSGEIVVDKRILMDAVNDHIQQKKQHSVFLSITKRIVQELSRLGGRKFV